MSAILFFTIFMHAPISQEYFYYFACHEVGGRWFVRGDYSLECGHEDHTSFMPFVLIGVVVLTFGLPFYVAVILCIMENRSAIHE